MGWQYSTHFEVLDKEFYQKKPQKHLVTIQV